MDPLFMATFKKIIIALADLALRRVFILFLVAGIIYAHIINQDVLKLKTLNYVRPSLMDLKEFADHPARMDKDSFRDILIYYKEVCDLAEESSEAPAACGVVAYAYYYSGEKQKSLKYYAKVIKQNGRFFWFFYNLAAIHFNEGHYQQAMDNFALALKAYPYSMGFFILTKTYQDMAQVSKLTTDDYRRSLDQGYVQAQKMLMMSKFLLEHPAALNNQPEHPSIDLKLY